MTPTDHKSACFVYFPFRTSGAIVYLEIRPFEISDTFCDIANRILKRNLHCLYALVSALFYSLLLLKSLVKWLSCYWFLPSQGWSFITTAYVVDPRCYFYKVSTFALHAFKTAHMSRFHIQPQLWKWYPAFLLIMILKRLLSDNPCSRNSNLPPGLHTRYISFTTRVGSSTEQSV